MTIHLSAAKRQICATIMTAIVVIALIPMGNMNFSPLSVQRGYSISDSTARTIGTNNNDLVVLGVTTRYNQNLSAFHVFGEILNNLTDYAIRDIRLNATFYDPKGNEIAIISANPFIDTLRSMERSPFDISAYGELARNLENFSYYKISKSWLVVTAPKPGLLDIQVDHKTLDDCGYYHIGGSVANLGPEVTNGVVVSASFYNERDQIVMSTFATPPLKTIKGGTFAPFEFVLESDENLPHFAYYSLNVQSDDYSMKIKRDPLQEEADGSGHEDDNTSVTPLSPPSKLVLTRKNVTVFTDSPKYKSDTEHVTVFGKITDYNYNSRAVRPFVVVKIISPAGEELYTETTSITEDGRFSKIMDFQNSDASKAQIYGIRAEYDGKFAENTFIVQSSDDDKSNIVDESGRSIGFERCKDSFSKMSIQQLVISSDYVGDNSQISYEFPEYSASRIDGVKVHSPITISVVAENRFSRLQPIVTVFEVLDSGENVIFLHLQDNIILPNSLFKIDVSWIPEEVGDYQIKSFVISGLEDPMILSTPLTTSLKVTN